MACCRLVFFAIPPHSALKLRSERVSGFESRTLAWSAFLRVSANRKAATRPTIYLTRPGLGLQNVLIQRMSASSPRRCTFGAVSMRGLNHSLDLGYRELQRFLLLAQQPRPRVTAKGHRSVIWLEADLTHFVSRAREGFLAFLVEETDFGMLITIRRVFMVHLELSGLR